MKFLTLTASALALAIAGTAHASDASADTASEDTAPAAAASTEFSNIKVETTAKDYWGDWGINPEYIKESVEPGDDFYAYVNGKWLDTFEIPSDRARYGSFTLLAEKSEQRVRGIIETLAAEKPDPATLKGKVAAYYNAFMDVDAINAAGLAPVQPMLDTIWAANSREDIASLMGQVGYASPFGGFVDVDSKQPDRYVLYLNQAGLGMPDRDYYLDDSERNLELQKAYKEYLTFLMGKLGYEDPAAAAASVYGFEKKIAAEHWDRTLGRNRDLTYNLVSKADLLAMSGGFPLETMLEAGGLADQQEFVVRQQLPDEEEVAGLGLEPEQLAKLGGGIKGLMKVSNGTPIATIKAYMAAQMLSNHAAVLPSDIDDATFAFYGTKLSGQEEQRERWKRGVSAVEGALGEGVGKIYAANFFPPENKAAMDDLVANLRSAMKANLAELDWMGADTREQAEEKLAKFTPKIGYTEKFETYDALGVTPGHAFDNSIAAAKWGYQDMISKLGEPIDKTEWGMLPQTVNAYYSPNRNEIVFPAAILQPPFFNLSADDAVNYGAIGGVIGHEMGHGFDDQGAKSDGDGVLRNWWTDQDKANFDKLTSALAGQYDAFCPLDDGESCVNGRLTLGENIGDLGGLSMAYRAYHMSLGGKEAPVIDGLTGDQRFFMAWAQVWRNKSREKYLAQQLKTDPHSPPNYRVNGVVRNFDEWYKAFNVSSSDALYLAPEDRIRIW